MSSLLLVKQQNASIEKIISCSALCRKVFFASESA